MWVTYTYAIRPKLTEKLAVNFLLPIKLFDSSGSALRSEVCRSYRVLRGGLLWAKILDRRGHPDQQLLAKLERLPFYARSEYGQHGLSPWHNS